MSSVRYAYKNDDVYQGVLNKLIEDYITEQVSAMGLAKTNRSRKIIRDALKKPDGMNPNADMTRLEDTALEKYRTMMSSRTPTLTTPTLTVVKESNPNVFRRGFQTLFQAGSRVISEMRKRKQEAMRGNQVGNFSGL